MDTCWMVFGAWSCAASTQVHVIRIGNANANLFRNIIFLLWKAHIFFCGLRVPTNQSTASCASTFMRKAMCPATGSVPVRCLRPSDILIFARSDLLGCESRVRSGEHPD